MGKCRYVVILTVFSRRYVRVFFSPIVCVSRLQCEVKLQRQHLSDSQHLLQSLRVELQVYEKMKTGVQKHSGTAVLNSVMHVLYCW